MGMKDGWKGVGQPDRAMYGTERLYPDPIRDNVPMKENKPSGRLAKGYDSKEIPTHEPAHSPKQRDKVGGAAWVAKGGKGRPHLKSSGKVDVKKNVEQHAK